MVDWKFTISKPLSELPPCEIKTYKFDAPFTYDFARVDQKICVGYRIHNHTGDTATYRINDQAVIDLKSLEEGFDNVQVHKLEFISVSDVDVIVKLLSFNQLRAFGALRNA